MQTNRKMAITTGDKKNILYVDDIQSNLTLFELAFKDEFKVFLASSGKEALEILEKEKIILLISDQRMPGMSGIELLEIVEQSYPEVIRFMLTAYSDYQTLVDSINKGKIYGYFNKPFNINEVKISLGKAIEVYNLRERNKQMLIEIEQANRELRNLERTKMAILDVIVNEIRSPISKIMNVIHMLKDTIGSSDLAELVNYLDSSVGKLEKFSVVASQLGILNEENMKVKMKAVSLRELIEISILENEGFLKSKQIKIQPGESPESFRITGNYDLLLNCFTIILHHIAENLENNSILYISKERNQYGDAVIFDFKASYTRSQLNSLTRLLSGEGAPSDYNLGIEMVLVKQIMQIHKGIIELISKDNGNITVRLLFKHDL